MILAYLCSMPDSHLHAKLAFYNRVEFLFNTQFVVQLCDLVSECSNSSLLQMYTAGILSAHSHFSAVGLLPYRQCVTATIGTATGEPGAYSQHCREGGSTFAYVDVKHLSTRSRKKVKSFYTPEESWGSCAASFRSGGELHVWRIWGCSHPSQAQLSPTLSLSAAS